MTEDSSQPPAPSGAKATWQIIMVLAAIDIAIILIFWLVFGAVYPIGHS
jgi:hypothetical protein